MRLSSDFIHPPGRRKNGVVSPTFDRWPGPRSCWAGLMRASWPEWTKLHCEAVNALGRFSKLLRLSHELCSQF